MRFSLRSPVSVLLFAAAFSVGLGQEKILSLDDALALAKRRNGTIRAAQADVDAARSRVAQAYSAFFPTVRPEYQYNNIRNEAGQVIVAQEGTSSLLSNTWKILDSGERDYTYRSSRRALEATRFNTQQTLRTTLFTVAESYYEALRSQELQDIAESQVQRAKQILDQTEARILAKDAAEIERLQANADYQNARVQSLVARNQVISTSASLKATIGLDATEPLPKLIRNAGPPEALAGQVDTVIDEGIKLRPDLRSRRSSIESERFSQLRADREAGVTFSVDLSDDYYISPHGQSNRVFGFLLSYPLFDGGQRRAAARELSANIRADRALLSQAERDARAEIESAYNQEATNIERLNAAKVAVEAAQKNYEAAVDSRQAGASDLQAVLTAQSTLLTAESNLIGAEYDLRISEVRLRLVTGRTIPGE